MGGKIELWVNRIEARRRNREEFGDILAEYFDCGYNDDAEIAVGAGLDPDEIARLRREFEK